jgi:hypothetical protein
VTLKRGSENGDGAMCLGDVPLQLEEKSVGQRASKGPDSLGSQLCGLSKPWLADVGDSFVGVHETSGPKWLKFCVLDDILNQF